jgi:D-3-phosphoglycerate dehydrogenase / 2-oxoglutarate reductase
MASPKCLIIDSMHDSLFPMLKEIGWKFDYRPEITRPEIRKLHQGYDGLIVRSKTLIDIDLLGDFPTIKFVARAGAGLDNLDLDYLAGKNIQVLHASEGNRDAVGEYAVGALLSLMRNIPKADHEVRNMIWEREGNRGEEIMDKNIVIYGYGTMGHAFARRLSGFGCNVFAYDKYKVNYSDQYATAIAYENLFDIADIVSLHIPLTSETRLMVTREFLSRFKRRIILMNTARGEIVSLSGLNASFEDSKVRGAVLDVLENEKIHALTEDQRIALNSLQERSNVIFTPHIAGWTYESHVKINVALVSKIKALNVFDAS